MILSPILCSDIDGHEVPTNHALTICPCILTKVFCTIKR